MTINKILLAMALGLTLASCAQKGSYVPTEGTVGDSSFNVQKLFTTEGCTVYRFLDAGDWHYFTNCTSTITTITESCGKNCVTHRDEENSTTWNNE